MAKYKFGIDITPGDSGKQVWEELVKAFRSVEFDGTINELNGERTIANNTVAVRYWDEMGKIYVKLHGHTIGTVTPDGVRQVSMCGYYTPTTADRIRYAMGVPTQRKQGAVFYGGSNEEHHSHSVVEIPASYASWRS